MAVDPKNPPMGSFVFDGAEFASYAVDVAPGGCLGLLSSREGFSQVCEELITSHPDWGVKAGITDQEIADLKTANERIARIDAFLPALLKAAEILTETRYVLDDQRQRIVYDAATSIDRRARRHPVLLAKYEKTRVYRSAIAKKGLKTKARNAEQKPADPGKPQTPADPGKPQAPNGKSEPQAQASAPPTT